MKLKFTPVIISACIALTMLMQSYASLAGDIRNEDPKEKKEAKKTKTSSSRNNNSVRIYPDILKRVMHVVAKDDEGKGIDFFVFDLEGTLIQHYKMKTGDHEKLAGLERGKYVFRVFSGDEETATGSFDIR
jgi:hypothetical protein